MQSKLPAFVAEDDTHSTRVFNDAARRHLANQAPPKMRDDGQGIESQPLRDHFHRYSDGSVDADLTSIRCCVGRHVAPSMPALCMLGFLNRYLVYLFCMWPCCRPNGQLHDYRAATKSVFAKSLPLNRSGSPVAFARAYEKQSP